MSPMPCFFYVFESVSDNLNALAFYYKNIQQSVIQYNTTKKQIGCSPNNCPKLKKIG